MLVASRLRYIFWYHNLFRLLCAKQRCDIPKTYTFLTSYLCGVINSLLEIIFQKSNIFLKRSSFKHQSVPREWLNIYYLESCATFCTSWKLLSFAIFWNPKVWLDGYLLVTFRCKISVDFFSVRSYSNFRDSPNSHGN